MNKPIKVSRRGGSSGFWQVLLMLGIALAVSLVIAGIWQVYVGADEPETASSSKSSAPELSSSHIESSSQDDTQSMSESVSEPEKPTEIKNMVPESPRVANVYFDDAVFVGDSISEGIGLYGVMSNTTVLAGTGINLDTVYSKDVVKLADGSRITIMDGLRKHQYKKVYILLGGNEVRDVAKDAFIKRYGTMLEDVKTMQPDAVVYVQSITPVRPQNDYKMDNARIEEYNEALLALCKEKNVYYVNIAESVSDETGALSTDVAAVDGMHFKPEGYNKWFTYLKLHTVNATEQELQIASSSSQKQTEVSDESKETQESTASSEKSSSASATEKNKT